MALSFGWKANDIRESIWIDDPAIPRTEPDANGKTSAQVPIGAKEAWLEDGDASHLEPYATLGKPTIIRFRALTPDERPIAMGPMSTADSTFEGGNRAMIRCFRMAVSFDGMEESVQLPAGDKARVTIKEHGVRMLALELVTDLMDRYPGMLEFYGNLVFQASFLTGVEKKSIIAAVHADAIIGGGLHGGHYGAVSSCGGCDGCPVIMRQQWACPDLGARKPDGLYNPVPGTTSDFDDCPAYYLRQGPERPAEHLIDGVTHPAHLVSEWAFEVESGSRTVESLSSKAREAVHLYVAEKRSRDKNDDELRKRKGARA